MQYQKTKNEVLLLEKVSVLDIYNTFITQLDPKKYLAMSDERNTGLCPFHVDTDPSLRYWKNKGIFHCFGCGFGGDAIKTYRQYRKQHFGDNLSLQMAIKQLAQHFGVELLPEEEGFATQSVFDRARQVLLQKEGYVIPSSVMTLAKFKKMNNQVINSKASHQTKVINYANLDLIATVNIVQRK